MLKLRVWFLAVVALAVTVNRSPAHPDTPPKVSADFVLVNGKVWTGDRDRPEVEAIASFQGRILAVGSTNDIRTLIGPKTVVLDVAGRRVVPGFHDSHVHMLGSGLRLSQVALKDAPDAKTFGERIAKFHTDLSRDRWLLGGEWDHDRTFGGRLPTIADIDPYCPGRPALIRRYDGHMALANSAALKIAGITAATPDPPGGVIYRDPKTKEPTGLLRDNAMDLVEKHIPASSPDEIVEAVRAALAEVRAAGVTSVCDMDGSDGPTRRQLFRVYQNMARAGQLTTRVELRWPLAAWEELSRLAVEADFGNDFLRIGGLKGFVDGSLGSSTAKMFEPFVNEPDSTGVYVTPRAQLLEWVTQADRVGLSVCVHAIGDKANSEMLDIYEAVTRVNGPRDRRFRIEHAQHLRPADYPRFAAVGVVASMQPFHVADDGRWAEGRIGPVRCESSYAFRSLLDSGAKLAFGSDWSVAPISPLLGIDAAVNRRTLDAKYPGGWVPRQKITVEEALTAYTNGSAYASHQDKERGSLTVGKFADFVVLSRDILAPGEADRIGTTEVVTTVVGGRVVHNARNPAEKVNSR
ncbi:MAG: amidohydrolase [Gemmataceae bacterium]|nr:amidohydrolase [Gemmataceae bacterium]